MSGAQISFVWILLFSVGGCISYFAGDTKMALIGCVFSAVVSLIYLYRHIDDH